MLHAQQPSSSEQTHEQDQNQSSGENLNGRSGIAVLVQGLSGGLQHESSGGVVGCKFKGGELKRRGGVHEEAEGGVVQWDWELGV